MPEEAREADRRTTSLAEDLGHVPAGQVVRYWIEFQVNPTTVGDRRQNVELDDGRKQILTAHRTLTVYP